MGVPPSHLLLISCSWLFHKPSIWGTPIYGNPQVQGQSKETNLETRIVHTSRRPETLLRFAKHHLVSRPLVDTKTLRSVRLVWIKYIQIWRVRPP